MTTGFIGLGVMGESMAANLIKAGNKLRLYTRTKAKAARLLEKGGIWEESPAQIAQKCDLVFTIVGYPEDVEKVYLSPDGLIANAKKDSIFIDMTTSSPVLAEKIAGEGAKKGARCLDAPVSGGDIGAREGTLSVMVGGEKEVFDRAEPFLKTMGKSIVYQGKAGAGQHCKMANQIAIASNMMGVCEALGYARKAGLDLKTILSTIGAGAAGSWSLTNLAPRMIDGNFSPGFYVKHFIKDMRIAQKSARELGLRTPGLDRALFLYEELAASGRENDGSQTLYNWYG